MSLRVGYLLLMGIILATDSGCCGLNVWGPAGPPCARRWCCSQCGEFFWNEWFSCPPLCCDSCSCCGEFTASNNPYVLNGPTEARFGRIYDDGGRRHRRGGNQLDPPPEAPAPTPAPSRRPTPAQRPTSVEELPPSEPTTALGYNEFGQTVSYEQPLGRSRARSRSALAEYFDPGLEERIDSPRPSRKLGKPRRLADVAR